VSLFKSQMDYKKLPNFSRYRIYPDGRVWSERRHLFMKKQTDKDGYLTCAIVRDDSKQVRWRVHRLIALLFIPNTDNKEQVDHIDRNKQNNSITNLRWANSSENCINVYVRSKLSYRHICYDKRKDRYMIGINQQKAQFQKSISAKKYTIEDAVKIRNEQYKIFGLKVDDKLQLIPDTCV